MRNAGALRTCLLAFALLITHLTAYAEGKFAIDVLHGPQDIYGEYVWGSIETLFPDYEFIRLNGERIPFYEILAEGEFTDYGEELVYLERVRDDVLYVQAGDYAPVFILGSDGTVIEGQAGFCHLDNPLWDAFYVVCIHASPGMKYRIGTGPNIADVYPYEDYDAVLRFWRMWTHYGGHGDDIGNDPHWSDIDAVRMQAMVDSGGSLGIFCDKFFSSVDKPIVHLKDFAANGASLEFDFPGRMTYVTPEPCSREPLHWDVAPTRGDLELDYEGLLDQHLNFVSRGVRRNEYMNRSWATLRDVKIIRFERNVGYQISELGTLEPGESGVVLTNQTLPLEMARHYLDQQLYREAIAAGLDTDEAESFFSTYQWTLRWLAEACDVEGTVIQYRIEGKDYDALIPLDVDPVPHEIVRVLWVIATLPDGEDGVAPVHPPASNIPSYDTNRAEGSLHEYGICRELYRSHRLDELEGFGWNFTGCLLCDGECEPGFHYGFSTNTWGSSPMVEELTAGVAELYVSDAWGIDPAAGVIDVVVSGDDSISSDCDEFPMGSYPPIVVAREEASGARLIGFGDHWLLEDYADNHEFTQNVFEWLAAGPTGTGPDIDIPVAVIETALTAGESQMTGLDVFNLGTEPLELTMALTPVEWISVSGPAETTILPGDSVHYDLTWDSHTLESGYHMTEWIFSSNDPNEAELSWPVRLRVLEVSGSNEQKNPPAVTQFELLPVYPNPFNPTTTIRYDVKQTGHLRLTIFNLLGQEVTRLVDKPHGPGSYTISWNAADLPSGIYLCRMEAQGFAMTRKVVLVK